MSKTDALDSLGVLFVAAFAALVWPPLCLLVFGVAFLLMSRSAIR